MSTKRSRGNDSTATCEVLGLTRHIMMVSLRSPRLLRSPKAGAYGDSGSMHALLSAPVIRKLRASGSAGGKVGGGAVDAVTSSGGGSVVTSGRGLVVVLSEGSMMAGA